MWKQLSVQSTLYNCALRLPRFALRDHSRCVDGRWVMNFPRGLDTLFLNLGRSQGSKLRRKYQNVLNRVAGKVRIRCFRSLMDLEPAISDMEAIASTTDKRRLFGMDFFDTPQVRERMVVATTRGWLRIYIFTSRRSQPRTGWAPSTTTVFRLTMSATIPFGASSGPGFFFFSISSKTFAMRTSRPSFWLGRYPDQAVFLLQRHAEAPRPYLCAYAA